MKVNLDLSNNEKKNKLQQIYDAWHGSFSFYEE